MNFEDFDEFSKVVRGFAELKGKELSPPALKLYFRALQHWPLDEFKRAAEHLLRTCEYMPTPKQFEDLRKAGEPTAAEAWTIVLSGAPLPAGSRMHRAAEACGGQYAIRHEDVERSLPFTQKRFLEAYEDLTKVDPVREAVPQIASHGTRRALSAPANIAGFIPATLQRMPQQQAAVVGSLPAPVASPPKADPVPTQTARDKILALLPLPLQMTDEAVAKVSGQPLEIVRQVRAEQERAA